MSTRRFRKKFLASIAGIACLGLVAAVGLPSDAVAQTDPADVAAAAENTQVPNDIVAAIEGQDMAAFRQAVDRYVTEPDTAFERAVRVLAVYNVINDLFTPTTRGRSYVVLSRHADGNARIGAYRSGAYGGAPNFESNIPSQDFLLRMTAYMELVAVAQIGATGDPNAFAYQIAVLENGLAGTAARGQAIPRVAGFDIPDEGAVPVDQQYDSLFINGSSF